ncbi:MAG TPA: RyR domain-containing protein [Acidobacteriota bacterium]|nr:hypothetical protein [Acidobacteriota bacterium]HNR40076.1 RyR domain-containing protein [Acidobacteriota bacterium]HNU02249.1 RyR domain-containing protein [Acidobacteriota bacterium]HPB27306.1 RyR domain-containing protein [Acidobacteriota bacterium]HQO25879.1 RyR domain-containing protein [Acidobacteriota bacterium]
MPKTVVIAGDVMWDHNLVLHPTAPRRFAEGLPHTTMKRWRGGAWYLQELVQMACADLDPAVTGMPKTDKALQSFTSWSLHPEVEKSRKQVWRIRQLLGCQMPEEGPEIQLPPSASADPDLVVLDDLGLGFRNAEDRWPAAIREGGAPRSIILKTGTPLAQGSLWNHLIAHHADRLTVVLSVGALRARRAMIPQALSWDRSIEAIVQEFENGPSAFDLARCRRVVVHFDAEGAACFTRLPLHNRPLEPGAPAPSLLPQARLERFLYHPEHLEGAWEAKHPGLIFGNASILSAALARHELDPETYPLFIAVGRALAAIMVSHECGFGPKDKFGPETANKRLRELLHPAADKSEPADAYFSTIDHCLLDGVATTGCAVSHSTPDTAAASAHRSDLLQDLTGPSLEYIAAKAVEVVRRGPAAALQAAPKAVYGKFFTVDRQEIERINAVRNLIVAYRNNAEDRRPLSLAVFGPPGSGKSFAIKQLVAELFGDDKGSYEFNLSQMEGPRGLHLALQQVRDAAIRGRIPLVFWDEFDTGDLRWLKDFLAPMQDAQFTADGVIYPLGKAIFVFAGGTCPCFEVFDRTRSGGAVEEAFRAVKGPDFVSRLRGFVNIKGPNPISAECQAATGRTESRPEDDPAFLIRRAIILRSTLDRFYPQLIDPDTKEAAISGSVLRAFLTTKEFLHGARSLESVAHMSNLNGARFFGVAELPPPDLLNLHVTQDFQEIVARAQLEAPIFEAHAEACHQAWFNMKTAEGWRFGSPRDDQAKLHPWLVPYDQLPEAVKEMNRGTARLTLAKLADLGYIIRRLRPADAAAATPYTFSADEKKMLVCLEHDIWLRDKMLRGYAWALETCEPLRLHRDIAAFQDVPTTDQELDWVITETIPVVLHKHGFVLERKTGEPPK